MSSNVAIVTQFIEAMKDKGLEQAPFAEHIFWASPFSGDTVRERKNVIRYLDPYSRIIEDVRVIRHVAEGDFIATWLVWSTAFGELSAMFLTQIENGLIAEINAFYDPRPFLENMASRLD
jgi:hypothetical protein